MSKDLVKNVVIAALDHNAVIEVTEDLTIESLWLDSLDVIEVIIEIEQGLPVSLDDDVLADKDPEHKTTVAEFIKTVEKIVAEA